jgi:hypothetical protein
VDMAAVIASGAPILCVDTCSLLEILRDPCRETIRAHEASAAHHLVAAAEAQRLIVVIARQVDVELRDNRKNVESETTVSLERFQRNLRRIDEVAAAFGAAGTMDTQHLVGHVARARTLVDRWVRSAVMLAERPEIASRAWDRDRVRTARTPSRKGKENMKDCTVIETYLDFIGEFRNAGGTSKAIFVSANTKDYAGDVGVALKPDLAAEFDVLGLDYRPNFAAARHALDL